MSSTKKFNKETGEWEVFGSTDAIDIKLTDLQGNFTSDNVEGALREASSKLSEISNSVKNHKATLMQHSEDIEWLKEHGGGGGGGGTAAPTITSTFADNTIVEKDKDVIIPIFFSSPNLGEGTAYIVIDGVEVDSIPNIKQGSNKINIGKLTNLKTEVAIYVKDRANLLSNQLIWNIICGGLDLEIEFDSTADYTVTDIILMQYTVTSASDEDIVVHMTIDYDDIEFTTKPGINEYVFQNLGVGIHKVTLYMTSGPYTSATHTFNIVVVNSDSLYVSTMFPGGEYEYGYPVAINYRISKASTEQFNIRFLLDDKLVKTAQSGVGSYYWTISDADLGAHTWAIEVTSNQGESQTISGEFTIIKGEYTPVKVVESGLVYRLSAEGRTNQDSDKENPIDNSGNGVKATLHNFNYFSNGWIDDTLVCDGSSYVEIDYYPWKDNAIYGSTIEVQFKGIDIGVVGARIFDYTDVDEPFKGVYIDLEESVMKSLANSGKVSTDADTWMTMTYVIDRKNKFGKIFIDGICSRAFFLSDKGSGTSAVREDFTHSQKIYLNSRKGQDKFGACEIKDVRIYSRVLTDDEILQNFISQEKDFNKQKELNDMNYNNKTLPVIRMYGDTSKMTLETPVTMRIKYTSPNEEKYGQSFDLPYCQVNWQGTSSLQYVLKNFTARLKDESMAPYEYSPYPNGIPEDVYCFKADYMESTHSRNAGLAKFVNECLYDEKNPAQKIDPRVRNSVNGFPCLMYINDQLQGVYNFNLDRYSTKSYGYTEDTTLVYEVSANSDTTAGAFYKWTEATGKNKLDYYKSDFECLYPPTRAAGNDSMEELIRLVEWVNDSSDEDFKDNMPRYFNLQYLLRYFLYVYVVGAVDSLGKNMKLATWDGQIWYPQVYDADTTLGLDNTGFLKFDMDIEMGDEHVFNTTGSVLWRRVRELFAAELNAQYAIMRQKHFTVENMMKYILEEQIQKIPAKYYNIDMQTKYLNYESSYLYALHGSGEHHIRKWLRERLLYCDTLFGYTVSTSDYITLRSSKLGYVYLDIQTYIPMYLRVKWRDEANNTGMQVKRIGRGETVRFEYNMPTATDQEIVVYGGHYLKSIGDVSNLEPTTMLIANADRLTEIECHSNNLINTDLSVCTKLQKIDISNSPALGTGVGAQPTLNIQNCKYLRYCNCYNTSLTAIYTMQSGGNLEELYYPATTQVVQISNQKHLKRVGLPSDLSKDEYCRSLQTVQITNCNAIQTLHYPFHENDEIDFSPFKYVQDLSITNSIDRLVFMSFSGFNKLKTLKLQSLKNLGGVGFDDMLGVNDVSAFESIVIADTPQIPQVSFNVSDPERYKIAFADNAVIDLSAMFGINTITSNAERLQGLKRILVPTTIKNINFPVDNEIKSIITGTSEHIADLDWEGYDLPGAVLETCDLSGIKITHAESLSLAPINEIPVINKNKAPIEFVVPEKGTYDLTNYVGSTLDNSFKGFDLSGEYNIKCDAALDKITSISSVFKDCKVDAIKINHLLERLPNLTSMQSTFANCTNLENPKLLNIPAKVTNFKQCFEGSDIKQDIAFKDNVIDVSSAFKNCNNLEDVTTNWETEYIENIMTEDCYAECNHITKFNGEDLFLTEYELGRDRIPVKWGGNDFQNENTAVYEVVTDAVNVKLVFPNRKCLLDNGRVDWGDGTITEGSLTHTYAEPGTYIIKGKLLIGDGEANPSETIRRCLTKIHKVPNIPIDYTNMFSDCRNLEYVDFTCGIPTNLTKTFIANTKLKTIKFGDLSQCAIFNNTFAECVELETIENFKVHSVCEDLSYVFNGCVKLKSLPNMNLWDTSNIKSLEATFYGCGITDFTQVENWDLTSCTSIYAVFARTNVKKINLSGWQINNDEESDLIFSLRDLFYHCEALQEVNVSNIVTRHVNNIDNMFYNCISLKTIIGLTTWDTSSVGSMNGLFYSVPINYFDFSGWDFSKLNIAPTNLWGSTPEKTIVLNNIVWAYPKQINSFLYNSSNYGKSKVTEIVMDEIREDMFDFSGMFKNCSELYTDIAFPTWATSVFECFKNCVGMKEIRSNWNTEYDNLTEENHLDCYAGVNIEKIDGIKDRVTSIPENWGGLAFRLDDTLEVEIDTILIESLNVTFTVDSYGAVLWGDGRDDDLTVANSLSSGTYVCTHTYNAHGVYTVKLKRPKLSYREGASVSKITSIPSDYVCDSAESGIRNKFTNNDNVGLTNVTSINISNLTNAKEKITTCAKAFYKMESLTEIIGLDQLDYSEVTSMASMFEGCKALTSVSMRNWDTTNVVNRENIFTGCQNLVFINVTDMILGSNLSSLFHGASTVTVIMGLADLQPENVTDLSKAFYDCSYLSFDTIFEFLSKIDTSKVQSMSKLFNNVVLTAEQVEQICNTFTKIPSVDILGCQPRLESLDLLLPIFEKADWSRPLDFSDLFAGWAKLKDVKALANYSTSTVYKANGLFRGCYELEDISGLRNWDTKGITDMSYMFYECKKLADLTPLREWDVSSVTNMSYMFSVEGESLIQTLDGLEKWDVSAVTNMKAMFYAVGGYGYNDYSCKDVSAIAGWNVIGVKDMSYMFGGFRISDYSLFNGWNIQSLRQAAFMFAHHWNVPSDAERTIDLSAWDVTNVSFGYAGIFYNCGWLMNFTSFKNINDSMFYIDDCVRLTVDSLMSIINNLKKTFSVKKLYIGEANMEKLTDEQLAVAIEKGWTVQ